MNNEKQTWAIPVPWTKSVLDDGSKMQWYLNVELTLGKFNHLHEVIIDFVKRWIESPEQALNTEYVYSVRPCSREMPIDEKTLSLPKFVNKIFEEEEK